MVTKPVDLRLLEFLRATLVSLVRLKGADLTSRQMSVLLICEIEDGPQTTRGLAIRLDVPKPAVTRATQRLVDFDLVKRAQILTTGGACLSHPLW